MGCRNSKTTNNNNKKKKILSSSSSPRTSSPSNNNNNIDDGDLSPISLRGRARTLSTSDLDYMSDEDYGDSDSDNDDQQQQQSSSSRKRRKKKVTDLATYRFINPFNRQLRNRFGDHAELKAGKVKLLPKSQLPNAQTKDLILFTSDITHYKIKQNGGGINTNAKTRKKNNKKNNIQFKITKETIRCICITLTNLYILTKVVRSKKFKVWKLFNKPNVNVLKLLFITSSRVNDDLILHFTEDLGGDIFIKCEDNKGELISVLQTLHRVKLDTEIKVNIVKETSNELLQKYYRMNRVVSILYMYIPKYKKYLQNPNQHSLTYIIRHLHTHTHTHTGTCIG